MSRMHRFPSLFLLAAALAASPALCTVCAAAGQPAAGKPAAASTASPATPAASTPLISLLLPLDSPDFAPLASAVHAGCDAAFSLQPVRPRLEIARTDASAARVIDAWDTAAQRGANVIIGPITRLTVSALAKALLSRTPSSSSPAPLTLTLNAPDEATALPPRFYTFGLSVEQEARAIARTAWVEGQRTAVVVQHRGTLELRASRAFADDWLAYGGRIIDVRDFDAASNLEALRGQLARSGADLLFLAASAGEARRVRPYLNNQIPVYATSQVNDGRLDPGANVDLTGIRFVDMPWLLEPDHAAVMVYPRQESLSPDLQRFYALGIDACRIAELMLTGRNRIEIDGVTGRLILIMQDTAPVALRAVLREPALASFRDSSMLAPPAEPAAKPPAQ